MVGPVFVRGITPYWVFECGCKVSAMRLEYCPIHAAAPKLLEALEDIVNECTQEFQSRGAWTAPSNAALEAAIEVLRVARGET